MEALDGSLLRLGVDYLDLYQMHAPPSKNCITECMDVMADAVKAGKVRNDSVSFMVMDEIANTHGKTLAQVAINWLLTTEDICVVPIPGMKNIRQVNDNMGALGWKLTKEERIRIKKLVQVTAKSAENAKNTVR